MIGTAVYRSYAEKLGASDPNIFVGNEGELFWDPNGNDLKISDGITPGGIPAGGAPVAKGYISLNGSTPTWTGTAGYVVSHSGGGGLDEVYTITFPTPYSLRTDYIIHTTYDGTDWVPGNDASLGVVRFADRVEITVRRWNEDPLNLGDVMVTIHNI